MLAAFAIAFAVTAANAQPLPARISDQDISDSYIYLLGRLLVTRQQQLDFKEGFKWNELVHRKPGAVDWPIPISTWPIPKPGSPSTRAVARS